MPVKVGSARFSSKCGCPGALCEEDLHCQSNVDSVMWAEGGNGMNNEYNFREIGVFSSFFRGYWQHL